MLAATVKSHLTRCAATRCLASAATVTLTAQWYQTYDQGVAAVKQSDWKAAEEKLEKAKKDAAAANQKPGRRVFRYGNLWQPFIPDYYLVQVYAGLADNATDDAMKREYIDRAVKASNDAMDTGQVRRTDAEFAPMFRMVTKLGEELLKIVNGPHDARGASTSEQAPPGSPAPAPVDPLQGPRREVQDLVARGERAFAAQTWDEAAAAFQQATARLNTTPALKTEFSQLASRAAEAALAVDISSGLRQLESGAFASAADTLERAVRTAGSVTASSQAVKSLIADAPKRLAEARLGQALTLADANRQQRHWAAVSAYESAQRARTAWNRRGRVNSSGRHTATGRRNSGYRWGAGDAESTPRMPWHSRAVRSRVQCFACADWETALTALLLLARASYQ